MTTPDIVAKPITNETSGEVRLAAGRTIFRIELCLKELARTAVER